MEASLSSVLGGGLVVCAVRDWMNGYPPLQRLARVCFGAFFLVADTLPIDLFRKGALIAGMY
jgi:hypothetical protein